MFHSYRFHYIFSTALIFLFFLLLDDCFAERKAIARFNAIPYQIIESKFELGVVAFHKNGIKLVDFIISDGQTTKSITVISPSINPRTKVLEYWVTIDPTSFKDGLLCIFSTTVPNGHEGKSEQRLNYIEFYCNAHESYQTPKTLFVSLKGNDSNNGSKSAPLFSIISALYRLKEYDGGEIILVDEGIYHLGTAVKNLAPGDNKHWIKISAANGLNPAKVILTNKERSLVRLYTRMIHWQRVSFDFKNIIQIYNSPYYWFDNCRWFSSAGRAVITKPVRPNVKEYCYVTDSIAYDLLYGFHFCKLLRNSTIKRISGDAIQRNLFTVNTNIEDVDGSILKHHSDVYQMWDEMDNIILFNVRATNIRYAQSIFLQPVNDVPKGEPSVAMTNSAFVNCFFDNYVPFGPGNNQGGPPFSQMQSSFEHIIFDNLILPWQQFVFRTDMSGNKKWQAIDVIFKNSILHYITFDKYVSKNSKKYIGPPTGVSFINCKAADKFRIP